MGYSVRTGQLRNVELVTRRYLISDAPILFTARPAPGLPLVRKKRMNPITAVNALRATAMDDISADTGSTVSLESRAVQAYAQSVLSAEYNKNDVMQRLELPGLTSPEELQAIQEKIADYSLKLSLMSTVSRKATSAVETLLRT